MDNLAALHEAIAEELPDRECLVFRDRRFSWSEFSDRTRRLADVLAAHGLGCHAERRSPAAAKGLENWESGQDHVACYLYNGNEYLEAMFGAYKARCAPFNVNYRYVEEELLYLFHDAKAKAVVFHAAFAPMLEKIRDQLGGAEGIALWLQVSDDSGNALLPGALDYEAALAEATPRAPQGLSEDDLYILYTGGTTGMPKGVLWRQQDILRAALLPKNAPDDIREIARAAAARPPMRALPMPPFMHGAAHWGAISTWSAGATVVVQSKPERLDPKDIWSTIERERISLTSIVGDAFARPLLDELDSGNYDTSSLRRLTSGGAIFTAELKRRFLERIPGLRISDNLGSSESGLQAVQVSTSEQREVKPNFTLGANNIVLSDDKSHPLAAGSPEIGWLARTGRMPLGYLGDPDKTLATFPVVDGVRYSIPGDRAMHAADGTLVLLGRDSVTINSGGEKIFAEEVEQALKHHPAVYDALVVGTPSERWGQQVTALVQLAGEDPGDDALRATAAEHVASYKLPKAFVHVPAIQRAPSGKPDYKWATTEAERVLGVAP